MSFKFHSVKKTIEFYEQGTLSPVDVCKIIISNIEKHNETYVAYNFVESVEILLKQAEQSAERYKKGTPIGSLDGIFVSIKDILEVIGWKTMYGANKFLNVDKDIQDHPCVARLREQGAIFVGKTTTPTFGWKGVTDSQIYGVTRNPYNPRMTSGGSSGGAAVSVALGMCHFAIGTDGGGSVRIPSSFCGISTIKPTYALIGHTLSKFGSLSTIGPMCSCTEDVAYALNVIGHADPTDWHSQRPKSLPMDYLKNLDKPLEGLKIAWSLDMNGFVKSIDPDVKQSFSKSLQIFQSLGATLEEVFPDFGSIPFFETFNVIWETGCANSFVGNKIDPNDDTYDLGLRQNVEKGLKYTSVDYVQAENNRYRMGIITAKFHEKYDVLITPTMPLVAFEANKVKPDDSKFGSDKGSDVSNCWQSWSPYTYWVNLTKQPASSVNMGWSQSNLPMGLQVVGPMYGEDIVLRVSHQFETYFK